MSENELKEAANIIKGSQNIVVFTGAGISVESGIPPFRGKGGLWNKYDPKFVEIGYFMSNTKECWTTLKEIFYDSVVDAKPNKAHLALVEIEKRNQQQNNGSTSIATQNIDALHQAAGSSAVYELHGNSTKLKCMKCGHTENISKEIFASMPPKCEKCGAILKPDFVFFGEALPQYDVEHSFNAAQSCDVCIVIGTIGEVMPAGLIPIKAKEHGAKIIEINPNPSSYTKSIVDIFIQDSASTALETILNKY